MDYAVKEMKKFDLDSYAIERKILELGNSTWNLFLSALRGEFFYKVCENRIPLYQLDTFSLVSQHSRREKRVTTKHRVYNN